jgi:hypothetical protein
MDELEKQKEEAMIWETVARGADHMRRQRLFYQKGAGSLGTTAVTPWYLKGGLALSDWDRIYHAKGATSLANSYVNIANPGTKNASAGTAPTWDAVNGWSFVTASNQYLITDVIPKAYSVVVEYTGFTVGSIWGSYEGATQAILQQIVGANQVCYKMGGAAENIGTFPAGVFIASDNKYYRNGVLDPVASATGGIENTDNSYIGAVKLFGGLYDPSTSKIQKFAVANRILTQAEITAISAAI